MRGVPSALLGPTSRPSFLSFGDASNGPRAGAGSSAPTFSHSEAHKGFPEADGRSASQQAFRTAEVARGQLSGLRLGVHSAVRKCGS